MKDKMVIGRWEGISLILNLICTQIILGFPRLMLETGSTSGWLLPVYITVITLILFTVIQKLYKRFEGKDIVDIGEIAAGKLGRIIVGLILMAYLVYILGLVLREFVEDMKVITLVSSPISFVTMFFISGMIIGSYCGLEALVRLSAIVLPIIAVGFTITVFGVAPFYDINNLFPILGDGVKPFLGKGFILISCFSGITILFLINPFLKTHRSFKIVGYTSIIVSGLFFFLSVVCYLLAYPYPLSIENFLPVYQLARLMEYGRFFQRVESIFVLIWVSSALLYLSAGFYLCVHVMKKTFRLEYYRPLIWPFIIIVYTISLIPSNLIQVVILESSYFRRFIWIVTFAMPILLLLLARLRSNTGKKGVEES